MTNAFVRADGERNRVSGTGGRGEFLNRRCCAGDFARWVVRPMSVLGGFADPWKWAGACQRGSAWPERNWAHYSVVVVVVVGKERFWKRPWRTSLHVTCGCCKSEEGCSSIAMGFALHRDRPPEKLFTVASCAAMTLKDRGTQFGVGKRTRAFLALLLESGCKYSCQMSRHAKGSKARRQSTNLPGEASPAFPFRDSSGALISCGNEALAIYCYGRTVLPEPSKIVFVWCGCRNRPHKVSLQDTKRWPITVDG
jgi:hypothetical protein